jgi:hypothetical protein
MNGYQEIRKNQLYAPSVKVLIGINPEKRRNNYY